MICGLPFSDKSAPVVVVRDGGNVLVTCILLLLTDVRNCSDISSMLKFCGGFHSLYVHTNIVRA